MFLSPPTFIKPLPDSPIILLPEQDPLPMLPLPQGLLLPLPSILLHDSPTHFQKDNVSVSPQLHTQHQPMDEDLDIMSTDNPTTHDCSDSSIYEYSELSAHDDSGSGFSMHLPPSSGVSSGVSSVITSDSDLPTTLTIQIFKTSPSNWSTQLFFCYTCS